MKQAKNGMMNFQSGPHTSTKPNQIKQTTKFCQKQNKFVTNKRCLINYSGSSLVEGGEGSYLPKW